MYKIVNRRKYLLTATADAVLRAVCWPRQFGRRSLPVVPDRVASIMVIRTAYVGDVVMTLPLLKPLRDRFPAAKISFLTSQGAAPLLRNHPHVDEILTYDPFWFYPHSPLRAYLRWVRDIRLRTFDLVIETRADLREILMLVQPLRARCKVSYAVGGGGSLLTHVVPYPGLKHKVEYHLDLARFLGCPVGAAPRAAIHLTAAEWQRVDSLLAERRLGGGFVALHPGSRRPLKKWSTAGWAEVGASLVAETGLPLALLGAAADEADVRQIAGLLRPPVVSLVGQLSLRDLAGVLARARLLICHDSGPMHIAAAMQTPVVAIFGPSKSAETAPYGTAHRVVEVVCDCRAACDEARCRNPLGHVCMQAITPAAVRSAARELLTAS